MFSTATYTERRKKLKELVGNGLIVLFGNDTVPINYRANEYPFRQDSTFLYYFGLDFPGLAATIDIDKNTETIYGNDSTLDDMVWTGPVPALADLVKRPGVEKVKKFNDVFKLIKETADRGGTIHMLPPYRYENMIRLEDISGIKRQDQSRYHSELLMLSIIEQRAVKSAEEVEEIEKALDISYLMYSHAMHRIKPGLDELQLFGELQGFTQSYGKGVSFEMILSIDGERLHNHNRTNKMKSGDLLLIDSGAESLNYYASDITRTFPVKGKFSKKQKAIYETVLRAQMAAIDAAKPGIKMKDLHLLAAEVITDGLRSEGLMKGSTKDAVNAGAHALFFPHGLGHMMGLDVHDMENLNENYVGYDKTVKRSKQFGLNYLRLARELKPGFVFTVEPGIYFIPMLFENWKASNKHSEFINYDKTAEYMGFGGIRIEDDVLITKTGRKVLGKKPIPKSAAEIEEIMAARV